eukprot:c39566_g1_i1 orf=1-156(-)
MEKSFESCAFFSLMKILVKIGFHVSLVYYVGSPVAHVFTVLHDVPVHRLLHS